MNTFLQRQTRAAFSLIELLVVIVVIAVCVGILLPSLQRTRVHSCGIYCVNNLKQIGLSFLIFANDNSNNYPMQLSTIEGGSREFVDGPNAFRHFQSMTNELSTPKILVCRCDNQRVVATNFTTDFDNRKLSYFVGLGASRTNSQVFLSGDRNITNGFPIQRGTLLLTTNQTVGWSQQIHSSIGNICLADGSVQHLTSSALRRALRASGVATNRLAIP